MINVTDKTKCSGCAACYNTCPINVISMESDHEGFLYPVVDTTRCINCSKCDFVCPYVTPIERETDQKECFAAYNKNESDRELSSSGGMFVALARKVFANGGTVYGAAYDDAFMVYHRRVECEEDLPSVIGSKYLQSRIGSIYISVLDDLKQGRQVLFCGTTCQVGGLRSYLKIDYNNLICVDFICLGIPSPKVWSDYLDTYFDRAKIKSVNFKDKSRGWHTFSLNIEQVDHSFNENGRSTYYFSAYFKQIISRPSCSRCIFKNGNRVSDITISDCWGYLHIAPEMDDNKGLSSIACHTKKGLDLFAQVQGQLEWKQADIHDVCRYNSNYCKSADMGQQRPQFWADYDRLPKKVLFKKYCSPEKVKLGTRIKAKLIRLLGRTK